MIRDLDRGPCALGERSLLGVVLTLRQNNRSSLHDYFHETENQILLTWHHPRHILGGNNSINGNRQFFPSHLALFRGDPDRQSARGIIQCI